MGRKYVLVDDYDGAELPEDTRPVKLSVDRTSYNLYLSDANRDKLLAALEPFVKDAETSSSTGRRTAGSPKANQDRMRAVREWAQANNVTYTDAQGNEKTLGDRGRIPQEVLDAYEAAH